MYMWIIDINRCICFFVICPVRAQFGKNKHSFLFYSSVLVKLEVLLLKIGSCINEATGIFILFLKWPM